jgi:hypothetical protein
LQAAINLFGSISVSIQHFIFSNVIVKISFLWPIG